MRKTIWPDIITMRHCLIYELSPCYKYQIGQCLHFKMVGCISVLKRSRCRTLLCSFRRGNRQSHFILAHVFLRHLPSLIILCTSESFTATIDNRIRFVEEKP